MKDFEKESFPVFDMFNNEWALATAGTPDKFNTCTIEYTETGGERGRHHHVGTL